MSYGVFMNPQPLRPRRVLRVVFGLPFLLVFCALAAAATLPLLIAELIIDGRTKMTRDFCKEWAG